MKNKLLSTVVSILILIFALTITVLDAVVPSLNIWVHPILTFLFIIFFGFGIKSFVFGFTRKSPWNFFISAVLLGISFVYAFICTFTKIWWLAIIIVVVLWAIIALISVAYNGNKTEDISLNSKKD